LKAGGRSGKLGEKTYITEKRVSFREILSEFFFPEAHEAEELFQILGALLLDHPQELAVFRPTLEKEEIETMVDDIDKVSGSRPVISRFINEVFGIKDGERGGRSVKPEKSGHDPKMGLFTGYFLNFGDIGGRESQGKLGPDFDVF
jgi:hypothetical protein